MLNHVKENTIEPRDFAYWLQGFFELREPGKINAKQAAIIEEHLALVLDKKTTGSMKPAPWNGTFGVDNADVAISC
tara:strand:- start:9157 stop:9384 length:228 start_codon:yes stop_codon:yes gene_type:complete